MARRPKKESGGAPAWMVTFSDMVTLLLTFFVLMLSMASMDQVKFNDAAGSLRDAFGVMKGGNKTDISKPKVVEFVPINDDFVSRLYKRMLTEFNRLKIDARISLVKDRGAVILRVNESLLFAPGQTEVRPESYPTLNDIARLLQDLPFHLRVEGHTDDTPVRTNNVSNWDISVARAVSVVKYMADNNLLPLDRLSAVGYGSQRPLSAGDRGEDKALNRRVDFVLESVGGNREDLPYLINVRDQMPF